jgi:hypothetical protein
MLDLDVAFGSDVTMAAGGGGTGAIMPQLLPSYKQLI